MYKYLTKDKLQIKSPAKINLTLDVVGKRTDGYHSLETVMQTVSIYDELILAKREERGITLATNLPFLPLNEKNLAYRATKMVFEYAKIDDFGVEIFLKKYIPVGAGLAGGSTNAAAAIIGVNELYKLNIPFDELMKIGAVLGADVPFCMCRGTYFATGIGEILTKLQDIPHCTIVVAKPKRGISTPHLFSRLDENEEYFHPSAQKLIDAIPWGVNEISKCLGNSFEALGISENPQIGTMLEDLRETGALGAAMTGSGSAVFGIFQTTGAAQNCVKIMRTKHRGCFVTLCSPISK